jgi:hypothetical protein
MIVITHSEVIHYATWREVDAQMHRRDETSLNSTYIFKLCSRSTVERSVRAFAESLSDIVYPVLLRHVELCQKELVYDVLHILARRVRGGENIEVSLQAFTFDS